MKTTSARDFNFFKLKLLIKGTNHNTVALDFIRRFASISN